MKAAIARKYGPPDVLKIEEVPKPVPKDNELLIKVYATTVNRTDTGLLSAEYFISRFFTGIFKPKPIPGTDFAGEVVGVGKDVKRFKVKDKVFGFDDGTLASHAEYLTIGENEPITTIPNNLTYEQATASIEGAHYAYNFIKKAKVKPRDKIMVNGATGAIGSATVQLLKYFGTSVTATSNTKNLRLIKSLGAERVVNWEKEDFTKDSEKYDLVFDAVGKSRFKKCKPILKPRGAYLSSELGPKGENIFLALIAPLMKDKKVLFPFPTDIKGSLHFIKKLVEEGKFKPVIDKTYPFEQIIEAYKYVETGQKTGNVVIMIDHDKKKK